jgi:hypothetical protein
MLVGYDYNSEEEGDYLPDDSIVIENPTNTSSNTTTSSGTASKKQSLIGLTATTSKLSKLESSASTADVENAANRKRAKLFSTSSKLHDILPAPKNEAKLTPDM